MDPTGRATNQPALAPNMTFGPRLSTPERTSAARTAAAGELAASIRMHAEDMTAPFSGRTAANRAPSSAARAGPSPRSGPSRRACSG